MIWIYIVGFLIAVFQDFKRREVDDWLNLFLFFSGVIYLVVSFSGNVNFIFSFGIFLLICALISMGMYSARIFAGGDAKMLFALSPLFFSVIFFNSIYNMGFFILSLFVCGSVYGLFYSGYFAFRDFKKIKPFFVLYLKKLKFNILLFVFVLLSLLGFYEKMFFLFSFLVLVFPLLFALAKSLDKYSMTKLVDVKYLKEGEWLKEDIKIGSKIIKSKWEGLSEDEVKLLRKQNKKVWIRDGVPYAFSFLLTLIVYYFKDYFLQILFS